jgi:hypothetical protein
MHKRSKVHQELGLFSDDQFLGQRQREAPCPDGGRPWVHSMLGASPLFWLLIISQLIISFQFVLLALLFPGITRVACLIGALTGLVNLVWVSRSVKGP